MQLREPVGVALETLRAHKMRSFLTLLGIILSVSTLIVVIALISGVNRYIAERVANRGNKKVTWDDYESLRENLKLPLRLGVEQRTSGKVRVGSQSVDDSNIRGV